MARLPSSFMSTQTFIPVRGLPYRLHANQVGGGSWGVASFLFGNAELSHCPGALLLQNVSVHTAK